MEEFYAIIDAKSVGLELVPENASTIIDKAIHIRNIINEKFEIIHPEHSFIRGLTHVEFYTDPTHESAHVKIQLSFRLEELIVLHVVQEHQQS